MDCQCVKPLERILTCITVTLFGVQLTKLTSVVLRFYKKRVVRIISKSNFDAPSDPIFKELQILKFDDIYSLELGKFIYSAYKNYLLPSKFKNAFLLNNQTHSYNTRIVHAFNLPFCRTNANRSKYFNSLDRHL